MRDPSTAARTLVLLEGESDLAAVQALARMVGCDLDAGRIQLRATHGVTNFSRALLEFLNANPDALFCGLYDIAEERHVRRALARAGIALADDASLEPFGFFACTADLEDELIAALGADSVERVIEAQSELASLRRFQAMPEHRDRPVRQQLRRFLGTRATRKIRTAPRLVEALTVDRLPRPLAGLAARLLGAVPDRRAGDGPTLAPLD
jgi:hypothetical protein